MKEIIKTIEKIAIKIANELKYAELGYSNEENATGDTKLKLDIKSDNIITEEFANISSIKYLVSEEKDEMLNVNPNSKFIVAYDPLDGSSVVDVNFSVGSIFGIYEDELSASKLVAAIYIIYGTRIEMVVCIDRPELFRLDRDGKFKFIKNLKLNQKGKINSTGGTQKRWSQVHKNFIKSLFDDGYRLRYSGAMVSDLHQILLKGGGLFSYPSTSDAPNGKLRVAFEVLPFAFIFEKANGASSDGKSSTIFDIKLEKIHQTTPCFFGSKYEITKLLESYNGRA